MSTTTTAPRPELGYAAFDADNHYYEAEDAFTRHIPRDMASRCMQWAEIGGRKRLLVGGRVNRFIPNPTFDPVSKPGALDDYFRGRVSGEDMRKLFGELDPISPAYRDRDARLAVMDAQGIEAAMFFPTLAVGMEESLKHDGVALCAAFRAFNRWLDEDWGFHYKERIFAAPYITLADPQWAVEEAEWAIGRGVRVVVMRTSPAPIDGGATRSPGDPIFDPFWARLSEAGVSVAFHSGDAGYGKYIDDWEPTGEFKAFQQSPMRLMTSDRAPFDMFAVLVTHGVLSRHPRLRLASIEAGADWVPNLVKKFKKAYAAQPFHFAKDPVEQFCEQVWIAPFYEDDIRLLADTIGVERLLFGSDYPHAEGLAIPTTFVHDLDGFSDTEIRRVMRDNGFAFLGSPS
ncbi:MAG: amidohydrolase family protein [Ilumatobacteraceae bacterium]|jgi:predicted TIM-barrel fold metal-dependent hydrolase